MSESSPTDTLPPFVMLRDMEEWVGADWIHPPGSDEAQLHVRSKLREEVVELCEALEAGSSDDIASEMGDVLWTSNAAAMNEGFELEDAVRYSLRNIQLPDAPLSLSQVDTLVQQVPIHWDVPIVCLLHKMSTEQVHTAIMDGDSQVTMAVLKELAQQLGKSTRMVHVIEPGPWTFLHEARTAEALGQIVLLVSHIAQRRLRSSLAEVMEGNRHKLLGRLASNQSVTKRPRQ